MQPVHTRVPAQLFGGCLQLLEFVGGFSQLLDTSDTFPLGVTLSVVERALCDGEVAGALSDLLQVRTGVVAGGGWWYDRVKRRGEARRAEPREG